MPKKKFIDRKKAVTFHLVHRSQQDPLAADETAPQRVLVPETSNASKKDKKKQFEEQQKFGIYFDDDYNYLQHLRDAGTMEWERVDVVPKKIEMESASKLKLPSSVFASEVEEDIGLLNKAAPQSGLRLELDPDIVAAMDEDFNFSNPENELEDNFMELANAEGSDYEYDEDQAEYDDDDIDSEERDEVCSLSGSLFSFKDEETKSRFTEYSMSSSVIKRNKQLTLLDDRFEMMYAGYDENEIGALDCDEIEGYIPENSDLLLQYANEFEKQQAREALDKQAVVNKLQLIEESDSEEEMVAMAEPKKEQWDCESILSTYSSIYNHPKLISEPKLPKIKINPKTGMPENPQKLSAKALAILNDEYSWKRTGPRSEAADSILSTLSMLSIRPKNETAEEKRERKKILKEFRRERRIEKKIAREACTQQKIQDAKIEHNHVRMSRIC